LIGPNNTKFEEDIGHLSALPQLDFLYFAPFQNEGDVFTSVEIKRKMGKMFWSIFRAIPSIYF